MVVDKKAYDALLTGDMNYVGQWATFDQVPTQAFARNNLALTPSMKTDVSDVVELWVTKPVNAQVGIVGAQAGATGGASQLNFMFPRAQGGQFFEVIKKKSLI